MHELKIFFPVAEAISKLFPQAEVVIHNLATGKISAIFNNLSKRRVGDDSLIEFLSHESAIPDCFEIYEKVNWDGKRLKSITAALKNQKGGVIGLLCINLDLSSFESMQTILSAWLSIGQKQPRSLFKDDFKEKINRFITAFLKKENRAINSLTKEDKQNLVRLLHKEGAFKTKNSAKYIAEILALSRATIYNYLKES